MPKRIRRERRLSAEEAERVRAARAEFNDGPSKAEVLASDEVVRDVKNELMFAGWIRAFSDYETPREILLRDVRVFKNSTGEPLYRVAATYLSRNNEDWTVEFPSESSYNRILTGPDGHALIEHESTKEEIV